MSGRAKLCSILYGVCLVAQGEPNVACAISCSRLARHGGCAVEGHLCLLCSLTPLSTADPLAGDTTHGGWRSVSWEVSCPRVRAALLYFLRTMRLPSSSANSQMRSFCQFAHECSLLVTSTGGHYTDCLYSIVSCLPP